MTIDVIMPQMGESIAEGTLVRWLKKVGDRVSRDEPLFEISTDKVDTEIPSPADGVLEEIRVEEGQTVAIETVVALLTGEDDSDSKAPTQKKASQAIAETPAPPAKETTAPPTQQPESIIDSAREVVQQASKTETSTPPSSSDDDEPRSKHRTSPLVRRIAREHDIDLLQVAGTGSGGRVTKKDILAYVEGGRPPAGTAIAAGAPVAPIPQHGFSPTEIEVEPMSTMRAKIAEHMVMSKHTSPHVTTVFEVDMTKCAVSLAQHKEEFLRVNGVKLTYMPFIMKAVTSALKAYPVVNAAISGKEIHYFKRVNLGIAVSLEDGLIVPVIKDADEKSLVGLARNVRDLAERARTRKLKPEDVQGGTFTISNHGVFGSLFATPVINQPQAAILGIGAVTKRPVVVGDSDAIAVRSMMFLALSFDHRLIDGATADRFLAHVKETLERLPYSPMD